MSTQTAIILDNIRSAHNVGSIFRTADAAGVSELFLCGTTPIPTDRFGRKRKDIAKVALGAEEAVPYTYYPVTEQCVTDLKRLGWQIVAVEQDARSINYQHFQLTGSVGVAFVFGDEVGGVSPAVLDLADQIVEIPMHGKKESLNVGVSVGVVLFQLN